MFDSVARLWSRRKHQASEKTLASSLHKTAKMAPSTAAAASPFNESKIAELRTLLGDETAREFIGRFRADLEEKLALLAGVRNSPKAVSDLAHKLVAVAATLGFDALSQSCQILRGAARDARSAREFAMEYAAVEDAARQALRHDV